MENTINIFADEFPEFIDGFNKNKIINKTGIHHQGIQGEVFLNGVLEPNAVISIIGTEKSTEADELAYFKLISVKIGHYTAKSETVDGKIGLVEFDITKRHITTINFHIV